MARPRAPVSSTTSTSTVGLPRESRTSRPTTCSMPLMVGCCSCCSCCRCERRYPFRALLGRLHLVPEGVEGGEVEGGHVEAAAGGQALDRGEALAELGRRAPQRGLGVEA